LRSREATLRVLLDTSFLLPSLGIDAGEEVSKGLKRLDEIEAEIYYSRFSILESLWVAARLAKGVAFSMETFSLGIRSIMESGRYRRVEEDSETFSDALKLYMLGHRDMVDNILYANSNLLGLRLLTLDDELRGFIRSKKLNDTLISPEDVA